jgi:hypothetical protein
MKPTLALLAVFCLLAPSARGQEAETIMGFYRTADSLSAYPSPITTYEIKCQRRVMKRYVTFIGRKGEKKIYIAAVTLKPLKNLSKQLALTARFDGPQPSLGETSTWGYVFDRNDDGKLDYLALVGAAAAVEGENFPDDFPGFGSPMSTEQFERYIANCRIVFNHWADDNYDGTIDAGVLFDMDPFRNWVRRNLLIRSTAFNGKFDDVRAFRTDIATATASAEFTPTEVPYYPLGSNRGTITKSMFDETTALLSLLNRAAALCKVGTSGF